MGLSCDCGDYDGDEWWWCPNAYSTLDTKRRRRCVSCDDLIAVGAIVAKFTRGRVPNSLIEERIHGEEEVPLAPWFMCERCADLYFSLSDLGYCVSPMDDMRDLVKEYAAIKEEERLLSINDNDKATAGVPPIGFV